MGTTFSVDTSAIQVRVTGTCPAGQSIRAIAADGSVTCEPDDDTVYSAGDGITISGRTIGVSFGGDGTATTASRSDHTHPYLPLSAMSVAQAMTLTGGGNADALHTHAGTPAPWRMCGTLASFGSDCRVAGFDPNTYEYGIAYNSTEPQVVNCTYWNRGVRIYNRHPYFVFSDNPESGMRWGGFVFYRGTDAADDDTCGAGYRHRYWYTDSANVISIGFSNGCYSTDMPVYCRERR
jgi:hypothetical protein